MGSTTIAVDTLDRLAVQLEGIQEAAKQLREIGSFQDAIADLTKQRDQLFAEVVAAKAKQAATLEKHLQAVDQAKQDVRAASDHAEKLVRDAKIHAQAILTEAAEQAALDLKADKDARESVLKDLQRNIERETATLNGLRTQILQAKKDADAIERRTVDATATLERVQEQARKLIGG